MAWGTGTTTKDTSAYSGPQGADSFDFEVGSGVPSVPKTGKNDFYLVDTFDDWNEQIRQHGTWGEHLQNIFSKRNLSREFQPEIDVLKDTWESISGTPELMLKDLKDSSVGEAVKDLSTWEGWWDAAKKGATPVTTALDTATSMASGITNVVPSAFVGAGTLYTLMKQGMPYGEAVRIAAKASQEVDEFIPDYHAQTKGGQKFESGMAAVFGTWDHYVAKPLGNAATHFSGNKDFGDTVAGLVNGALYAAPMVKVKGRKAPTDWGAKKIVEGILDPAKFKNRVKLAEKELYLAVNDPAWVETVWRQADPQLWSVIDGNVSLSRKYILEEIPKVQDAFRSSIKDIQWRQPEVERGNVLGDFTMVPGENVPTWKGRAVLKAGQLAVEKANLPVKAGILVQNIVSGVLNPANLKNIPKVKARKKAVEKSVQMMGDTGISADATARILDKAHRRTRGGTPQEAFRAREEPFYKEGVDQPQINEYRNAVARATANYDMYPQPVLTHEATHFLDAQAARHLFPYSSTASTSKPLPRGTNIYPDYAGTFRPIDAVKSHYPYPLSRELPGAKRRHPRFLEISSKIDSVNAFSEAAVKAKSKINKSLGKDNPTLRARGDRLRSPNEIYARLHGLQRFLDVERTTLKDVISGKFRGPEHVENIQGLDMVRSIFNPQKMGKRSSIERTYQRYGGNMPGDALQILDMVEEMVATGMKRSEAVSLLENALKDIRVVQPTRYGFGGTQPYGGMISQYGAEGAQ